MSKERATKRVGLVGRNLLRYRRRQGKFMSQEELATRAGISRGTIADLERGQTQSPDEATVMALATALDLSPADLWRDDGEEASASRQEPPVSDRGLPPGLSEFVDRHRDDLSPREIRELSTFSFSLNGDYSPGEKFWLRILSAIRLRLTGEDGGG